MFCPWLRFEFHRVSVDEHFQVVAVNAVQRVAHGTVFGTVAADDVEEVAALSVRHIPQRHLLAVVGYAVVDRPEKRV